MNGRELSELIHQRWSTLKELLEMSDRQVVAIEAGHMSELMKLLSDKQKPLSRLAQITAAIREASDDDPTTRVWESEQVRQRCREQQDECERMHMDLLAIEAECETALQASRDSIQQKLERVDAGRQAASKYAGSETAPTSGGRLDLSSD